MRVFLESVSSDDEDDFLAAVQRSQKLHHPWITPPGDHVAFLRYLARPKPNNESLLVRKCDDKGVVGVINISEIVRGVFQSAYLGYYCFEPYENQGFMKEGISLAQRHAFQHLKLHRLEANIQLGNHPSISLVKACGFLLEGLSRRYLKVNGRWRDHERWAVLAEDWRARSRRAI